MSGQGARIPQAYCTSALHVHFIILHSVGLTQVNLTITVQFTQVSESVLLQSFFLMSLSPRELSYNLKISDLS